MPLAAAPPTRSASVAAGGSPAEAYGDASAEGVDHVPGGRVPFGRDPEVRAPGGGDWHIARVELQLRARTHLTEVTGAVVRPGAREDGARVAVGVGVLDERPDP